MTDKFQKSGKLGSFTPGTQKKVPVSLASGLVVVLALGLGSCASSPAPKLSLTETGSVSTAAQAGNIDCGKMTGRMQIRIMQIRNYKQSPKTSDVSHTLQGMAKSLFGGTTRGLDPDGDYARDIEQLRRQNAQLAARGCKTFDLEAELQPKNFKETPTPR